MATVQQVQAVESGQQRLQQLLRLKKSAMQHIKNGGPVNVKDALTGSAVTAESIQNHPEIEKLYLYPLVEKRMVLCIICMLQSY